MTQHTPGPWEADDEDIFGQDNKLVARIAYECNAHSLLTPEDHANARLIAAAPQLLEALERLTRRLDSHFGGTDRSHDWKEQEQARAAIHAATEG